MWKIIHRFLLWFPLAMSGAYAATLGLFAAAAQAGISVAKQWLASQFTMLAAMLEAAYLPLWIFALVVVWLSAFLWSSHKAEQPAHKGKSWVKSAKTIAQTPPPALPVQDNLNAKLMFLQAADGRLQSAESTIEKCLERLRQAAAAFNTPDHWPGKAGAWLSPNEQFDEALREVERLQEELHPSGGHLIGAHPMFDADPQMAATDDLKIHDAEKRREYRRRFDQARTVKRAINELKTVLMRSTSDTETALQKIGREQHARQS